jgi:hypothetical protein
MNINKRSNGLIPFIAFSTDTLAVKRMSITKARNDKTPTIVFKKKTDIIRINIEIIFTLGSIL